MDEAHGEGELATGDSVAGYKIRGQVGEGTTGRVYSAIRPVTGEKVAVKVIHPFLVPDEEVGNHLIETVKPLVGLTQANLLTLVGCGRSEQGQIYLISEFVQGQALTDLLSGSAPLVVAEAWPLLRQLLAGLRIIHNLVPPMVHGNLSPNAVWLSPREDGAWPPRLRLTDFGISQLEHDVDLPYYLAPEQCRGEVITPATDLYAVGVIAYQMLSGRLPFSAAVATEVRRMHLEMEPPRPPKELDLPVQAEALLLRLLAKDPAERHTMETLAAALDRLEQEPAPDPEAEAHAPEPAEVEEPAGAEDQPTPEPAEDEQPEPAAEEDEQPAPAAEEDEQPAPVAEEDEQPTPEPEPEEDEHPPELEPEEDGQPAPEPAAEEEEEPVPAAAEEEQPGEPDPVAVFPPNSGPIRMVTTGVLPKFEPRSGLTPLVSAVLAVIAAIVVGAVAYRLLTDQWPLLAQEHKAQTGSVMLHTTPPGALVYLNGVRQVGKTPMTVPRLHRGRVYDLYLHLPGHRPWRQTVSLGLHEAERQMDVVLGRREIRFGTLKLTVNVKADIFLDSRRVGTQTRSATLVDVQAGVKHRLRISAPNYLSLEQEIEVDPGKVRVLELTLRPKN